MSRSQRKWGGLTLVVVLVGAFAIGISLIAGPGRDAGSGRLPPANEADVKAVAEGNNRFALDLYGKLKKGDENLFYSPYSISTALAMTYAGARGSTAEEMAKVLHFGLPPDRLHPACGGLVESLNEAGKKGGFQLSVANRLWGQKGEPFVKEFIDLTGQVYHAPFETLDFKGNAESARKTVNQWVEKQTADKIKDLLQPPDFVPIPVLILTNAIYMKADWLSKFDKKATKAETFFAPGNRELNVPTMHQTAKFPYMSSEETGLQVLELPYVGERLAMVILLPRHKDGLADLEKRLTLENVSKWLAGLKPEKVRVSLPRFAATQRFDLKAVLQSMGMVKAFGAADFSGMNGVPGDLFISKVIHKAFVNVDEEGTEAAGATAVVMARNGHPMPQFRADHPFVFLIRDRQTGAVLFMGRVTDPKAE